MKTATTFGAVIVLLASMTATYATPGTCGQTERSPPVPRTMMALLASTNAPTCGMPNSERRRPTAPGRILVA